MKKIKLSTSVEIEIEDKPFAQGVEARLYYSVDRKLVAKLYKLNATDRARLEMLISLQENGQLPQRLQDLTVWPMALIEMPSLGVIMRALPENLRTLNWFVSRRAVARLEKPERGTWLDRVRAATTISELVVHVHKLGMVFTDLSPHNICVSFPEGKLIFIDCDSIVPPGPYQPNVLGHRRYQAPEIVMGAAPTQLSDLHSLAVTIYLLLFLQHPLLGTKDIPSDLAINKTQGWGEALDLLELGKDAQYISQHRKNPGRRPSAQIWPSDFSELLDDICQKAFVAGLHDPQRRPSASDWHDVLVQLTELLRPCSNENCIGRYSVPRSRGSVCYWCSSPYLTTKSEAFNPVLLFNILRMYFDDSEVEDLAFKLRIDYDNLSGNTKDARIRALINHLERRERLSELIAYLRGERPEAYKGLMRNQE